MGYGWMEQAVRGGGGGGGMTVCLNVFMGMKMISGLLLISQYIKEGAENNI